MVDRKAAFRMHEHGADGTKRLLLRYSPVTKL